jgi:putative transposase
MSIEMDEEIKRCTARRKSPLENTLTARSGALGKVATPFLPQSDNGDVFTSRTYTRLVRSYGIQQQLVNQHCPQ